MRHTGTEGAAAVSVPGSAWPGKGVEGKARVSRCPRAVVTALCGVGALSESLEWGKVNSTYLVPDAGCCCSLIFSSFTFFFPSHFFFFFLSSGNQANSEEGCQADEGTGAPLL